MTYSHYHNAHQFRTCMGQACYSDCADLEAFQLELIDEEWTELHEALQEFPGSRTECLKELADLVYVCYQFAAAKGWNLDEALQRVHESNMSKLVDGKPLKNEYGKVLKGPNYQPPILSDLAPALSDLV